jgi:pimeloyl-ACP methyl ester carboxylesterase
MKDIPLEVLDGLRDSPLWEPFVAHAECLRADAQALEWAMSAPHRELFGTLGVPTLVVVGRETFDEMPAAAASLAAALPDATRAEVAGAQHSWEPAAMADLLEGFLRARYDGPPARVASSAETSGAGTASSGRASTSSRA